MTFFKTLSETGIQDVVIQVKQDKTGSITVFVTPKTIAEDSALKGLKPLHLTGTPEEIDSDFFSLVTTPLIKTQAVFNNVEAFEAQLKEATKATAEKKAEKDAAAKAKKEEAKTTDSEGEVAKPIAEKVVKVNNEKVLKDFIVSIKNEDILIHKEKIEELCGLLSETELSKPYYKKVRMDLDIAIRKEANIQAAREKHGFVKKEEVATESKGTDIVDVSNMTVENGKIKTIEEPAMTEQVSDVPEFIEEKATDAPTLLKEAIMSVVTESPNVDSAPGHVVEQSTPKAEPVVAPPMPAPTPVFEDVQVFEMIDKEYTKEEFVSVGWTEELLIEHGKAHYVTIKKEVVPTNQKISYTFPKPFDAEDEE